MTNDEILAKVAEAAKLLKEISDNSGESIEIAGSMTIRYAANVLSQREVNEITIKP